MAEFPLARDRHQQRDSEININKFIIISSITLDKFVDLQLPLIQDWQLSGAHPITGSVIGVNDYYISKAAKVCYDFEHTNRSSCKAYRFTSFSQRSWKIIVANPFGIGSCQNCLCVSQFFNIIASLEINHVVEKLLLPFSRK